MHNLLWKTVPSATIAAWVPSAYISGFTIAYCAKVHNMTVPTATILACTAMLIFQNAQSTHYLRAQLGLKNVSHGTTLSSDEIKSTTSRGQAVYICQSSKQKKMKNKQQQYVSSHKIGSTAYNQKFDMVPLEMICK